MILSLPRFSDTINVIVSNGLAFSLMHRRICIIHPLLFPWTKFKISNRSQCVIESGAVAPTVPRLGIAVSARQGRSSLAKLRNLWMVLWRKPCRSSSLRSFQGIQTSEFEVKVAGRHSINNVLRFINIFSWIAHESSKDAIFDPASLIFNASDN